MANKNLLVYPNPYAAVDHEGLPSGVVAGCPEHGQGGLVYPGASVDEGRTVLLDHPDVAEKAAGSAADRQLAALLDRDKARSRPQRTRWKFSREPVPLPATAHYLRCLRDGDLVPADEATSTAVGLRHRDPLLALAEARQRAVDEWVAAHAAQPRFALEPEEDVWPDLAPLCEAIVSRRDEARAAAAKAASAAASAASEAAGKAATERGSALSRAIAALTEAQLAPPPAKGAPRGAPPVTPGAGGGGDQ